MLDYYFTLMSPFSYLGHDAFLALAKKHDAPVRFRPVRVMQLFAATGGVPLAQRALARQQYRLLELQRWRELRALPLNIRPKHFPVNPEPADRAVIAIVAAGGDPAAYMRAMYRAIWAQERDIADTAIITAALSDAGHDSQAVLHAAAAEATARALDENTAEAIAMNLPGVPGYVRAGEVFWGQDRLDLLDRALASGRPAFTPAA